MTKNGEGYFEYQGVKYPLAIIAEEYQGPLALSSVPGFLYVLHLKPTNDLGYCISLVVHQEGSNHIAPGKLLYREDQASPIASYFDGEMILDADTWFIVTGGTIEIERKHISKFSVQGELKVKLYQEDESGNEESITFWFTGNPLWIDGQ